MNEDFRSGLERAVMAVVDGWFVVLGGIHFFRVEFVHVGDLGDCMRRTWQFIFETIGKRKLIADNDMNTERDTGTCTSLWCRG